MNTLTTNDVTGVYLSVNNKFEKASALTLNNDSTFLYEYALGGCQDEVKGKWALKSNQIYLTLNINRDSVVYHIPDLNNVSWTIVPSGIRPNTIIDNGCFKEKALHKKQKR
ncbi:MAG: hypothetical protein QM802_04155 [Agriterribacter sp.]